MKRNLRETYGSKAFGTIVRAALRFLSPHSPFSRPKDNPIRFKTSISSWISKASSKLNKYSDLEKEKINQLICDLMKLKCKILNIQSS